MSLYETDFVKWAEEQATLLAERRFDLLDLDNLIEEVDDLAGRHRDALQGQLKVLLIHLIKMTCPAGSREPATAWKRSIRNARDRIDDLIDDHPSLRSRLGEFCERAYPRAVRDAHNELSDYGDEHEPFPEACP